MSATGICVVTPGHTFTDNDTLTAADLNAAASPVVTVGDKSIGKDQIVRAEVIELIGADIAGYNYLDNGGFYENRWTLGTTGSAPTATKTVLADKWFANPAGAAVTYRRSDPSTEPGPDRTTLHHAAFVGATGATTLDFGQDIPRRLAQRLRTQIVLSFWLWNDTGASVTPVVKLNTPNVADTFTLGAVTNIYSQATSAAGANQTWTKFTQVIVASGTAFDGMARGVQVVIQLPSGTLDSTGKKVRIAQAKLEVNPDGTATEFVPVRELPLEEQYTAQQAVNTAQTATNTTNATAILNAAAPGSFARLYLEASSTTVTAAFENLMLKELATGKAKAATFSSITASTGSTGIGGIDTGTVANNTWYYVWICQGATGTGMVLSTSATTPTLPSGYNTHSVLIGEVFYVTTALRKSYSNGRRVICEPAATSSTALSTSSVQINLATAKLIPPMVSGLGPTAVSIRARHASNTNTGIVVHILGGAGTDRYLCGATNGVTVDGIGVEVAGEVMLFGNTILNCRAQPSANYILYVTGYDR